MEQPKEGPPGNEAKILEGDIQRLHGNIGALGGLKGVLDRTPPRKQPGILGQITGVTKR